MKPDAFSRLDAVAQAGLVRSRQVKPSELVESAIRRIEAANPALNAVILPAFELALEEARRQDQLHTDFDESSPPFVGVPFLMKDLGGQEAGRPFHMGIRGLKEAGWVEPVGSYLVDRMRAAGLVSLGRTNTPELGLMPTTEPLAYGPTHNPWNLAHSPGGSSGGASAAVAAGLVPAAHASDGGGSIRIPAAHTGLVGLKPTRGRSSFGPALGERWAGFSCELVVAHTVRDTAAFLDVFAGAMPGDPYYAEPPGRPYVAQVGLPVRPLRIGLMTRSPNDSHPVHPDCVAAAQRTATALTALGHHVEEAHPEALDDANNIRAFVTVVACAAARTLTVVESKLGRPVTPADVEPLTWAIFELGKSASATMYLEAIDAVHSLGRRMAAWWEQGFDLLLTPTSAQPAPLLGELSGSDDAPLALWAKAAPYGCFTSPFNQTGQPGISLPVHVGSNGLPTGAHLVAAYGREDLLIRVAAQIEQALPWRNTRAPGFY